jgi:preprotein translocase subunit SecA
VDERMTIDFKALVSVARAKAEALQARVDCDLVGLTLDLKRRLASGASVDSLVPDAFAAVIEAARVELGVACEDAQIRAGAEIVTGSVVCLDATADVPLIQAFPAYVHALAERGVDIPMLNDVVAGEAADRTRVLFRALGLETGLVRATATGEERRIAYEADITYGNYREFCADYLRNHHALDPSVLLRRELCVAVVHDAYEILADMFGKDVIGIGGPADAETHWYVQMRQFAEQLRPGIQYTIDAQGLS